MKYLLGLATTFLLLTGCEKVIELDLNESETKLVIEGYITNEPGPYFVKLSKSVRFDAASQYPVVTNAQVIITDNTGIKDTLVNLGNGSYRTVKTVGLPGRTYGLSVVADGNTYTASSTMPATVALDSLRNNKFNLAGTVQNTIIPVYTDPVTLGNNYRFLLYVNNVLDKTYLVWNDNAGNGVVNQRPFFTNDIELKKDNLVRVEMQCVDATVYNYFFTLLQAQGGGPGGGTTPSNPPNGITGNALGIFSAHTVQVKTTIVP